MKKLSISKFILVPAVLLSLQSCFVAKDYSRPEVNEIEEGSYRTDLLPQQDTISMAEVSWRELFTDPVLSSHIETALENNIDIRIALQQIEAAEAYMKQGRAGYLPSLSVGASGTTQNPSDNGQLAGAGTVSQFDLSANLTWEADIWGRIRSNDRATQAGYLRTVAAHQAVKTQLIAGISTLYYQLLALDEQIRVTSETIENRESSLVTTRALKDAGTVTEVAVQQTQAQLFRAQAVLVDLETGVRLLENAFSILLGETPHAIERTSLAEQEIDTELKIGVPAQLLRNRPDVMAAEYNLVNAFELTNVARSSFYPTLSLSANAGLQSLEFEDWFSADSFFASILGNLAQPIFNRRQIRTQYEVAQAQEEIAFLDFRRSLLVASREVSDALYSIASAEERLEYKAEEFEAYDLATTYSEELLNYGLANYLEVLTARENSLNARLELINTELDRFISIVDLYQALGGGWK